MRLLRSRRGRDGSGRLAERGSRSAWAPPPASRPAGPRRTRRADPSAPPVHHDPGPEWPGMTGPGMAGPEMAGPKMARDSGLVFGTRGRASDRGGVLVAPALAAGSHWQVLVA